jgi:DNA-binding NtrC family response regulator
MNLMGSEALERFRILVVDDSLDNLMILSATLDRPGYVLVVATSGEEAIARASERAPDLVLLDVRMPGLDGLETCRRFKADARLSAVPVIFMSGLDRVEDRVAAFDAGGIDFVGKPFHPAEVQARVKTHLALAGLNRTLRVRAAELEREVDAAHAFRSELLATMIAPLQGNSAAARELRAALVEHAAHDEPVLLVGHPGNGAEAAARSIHERSSRCWRPFVRAEPGAPAVSQMGEVGRHPLARSILERAGLAEGGTLWIENVSGLAPSALEELSRVLERGADVRLLVHATSQADLPAALSPILRDALERHVVRVPELEARREDIPEMCAWILGEHAARLGKTRPDIPEDVLARLVAYPWRGGLAELEAVVRRALLVSPEGEFATELGHLEDGRRLGSYRLIERLGEGGMGEVWRAKHEHLPRPCAVKVISTKTTREDLHRAQLQFRREAMAIWDLQSPHTVRVHDFGASEDGELYYAMELLEGLDLHWMVRVDGALPPARAVHFLRQTASSLAEAHALGLVHRDVKPANLFACRQGHEYDWLKVLDFGTVALQGSQPAERVFGTTGYLAPELLTREGEPSSASDVYALGCCAYWLVVGAPPFAGSDPDTLARAHVRGPVPRPSLTVKDLPSSIDDLVLACMARRPADRPSAAELVETLEELARGLPWPRAEARRWWLEHGAEAQRGRLADPDVATTTLHDVDL